MSYLIHLSSISERLLENLTTPGCEYEWWTIYRAFHNVLRDYKHL